MPIRKCYFLLHHLFNEESIYRVSRQIVGDVVGSQKGYQICQSSEGIDTDCASCTRPPKNPLSHTYERISNVVDPQNQQNTLSSSGPPMPTTYIDFSWSTQENSGGSEIHNSGEDNKDANQDKVQTYASSSKIDNTLKRSLSDTSAFQTDQQLMPPPPNKPVDTPKETHTDLLNDTNRVAPDVSISSRSPVSSPSREAKATGPDSPKNDVRSPQGITAETPPSDKKYVSPTHRSDIQLGMKHSDFRETKALKMSDLQQLASETDGNRSIHMDKRRRVGQSSQTSKPSHLSATTTLHANAGALSPHIGSLRPDRLHSETSEESHKGQRDVAFPERSQVEDRESFPKKATSGEKQEIRHKFIYTNDSSFPVSPQKGKRTRGAGRLGVSPAGRGGVLRLTLPNKPLSSRYHCESKRNVRASTEPPLLQSVAGASAGGFEESITAEHDDETTSISGKSAQTVTSSKNDNGRSTSKRVGTVPPLFPTPEICRGSALTYAEEGATRAEGNGLYGVRQIATERGAVFQEDEVLLGVRFVVIDECVDLYDLA